jgi:ankyrin repeat protein
MLRKLSPMTVGDVAFSGDEPKLRRLLLAGANPNDPAQRRDDGSGAEPKQRDTPLMDAVWRGHGPVVETLIASRADLAATNADGLTALHLAAQWGHVGITQQLVRAGAGLDERTCSGATPLFLAATFNQTECARKLVLAGADATIPTDEGATPADVADDAGFTATATLLRNLPPMIEQVAASNENAAADPYRITHTMYLRSEHVAQSIAEGSDAIMAAKSSQKRSPQKLVANAFAR